MSHFTESHSNRLNFSFIKTRSTRNAWECPPNGNAQWLFFCCIISFVVFIRCEKVCKLERNTLEKISNVLFSKPFWKLYQISVFLFLTILKLHIITQYNYYGNLMLVIIIINTNNSNNNTDNINRQYQIF